MSLIFAFAVGRFGRSPVYTLGSQISARLFYLNTNVIQCKVLKSTNVRFGCAFENDSPSPLLKSATCPRFEFRAASDGEVCLCDLKRQEEQMQNPLVEIRSIRNLISRRWSGPKAPERTEPEPVPLRRPKILRPKIA